MPAPQGRRPDEGRWGPWSDGGPPRWGGGYGPRGRRRGFGCFFGLIFLIVAGSLIATIGYVLSHFGGLAAFIALAVVVGILLGVGRGLRSAAATLDELVEATRAVETGDYTVRVGPKPRGLRPVRQLVAGFDTMTARLETDERQRRTLLAEISHELRTPLAVLQGNLEAIIDGVYPADPAHLEPILAETRILEHLIDDLRTLSLAEAGSLVLHREPTDLGALLSDVAKSYQSQADQSGVTLTVTAPDDLPPLDIDPARIREVVANLLTNALRHTPRDGSVELSAALADDRVEVTVHDTGSGIPPDQLDRIFDRFYRSPDSPGSGLGLPIAKSLVEAQGGTIAAASEPGGGTTIRVKLPVTEEPPPRS